MKVRTNFVSNSSSSSFIIGVGRVFDLAKAMKAKEDYPDIEIRTLEEIITAPYWNDPVFKKDRLEVESDYCRSGCSCVDLQVDVATELNTHFAIVSIHNNEGDDDSESRFYQACYEGGSIDESYFGTQADYLHLGEEHGIRDYQSGFGCGRNG